MRTPHTAFSKGTTIRIKLRSGEVFIDKFEDAKSGVMILRERGRISKRTILSCSIYKGNELGGGAEVTTI
jgi:hypothetical protein